MTDKYAAKPWSLNDLYPGEDSKELKAALKKIESATAAFEKQRFFLAAAISSAYFLLLVSALPI